MFDEGAEEAMREEEGREKLAFWTSLTALVNLYWMLFQVYRLLLFLGLYWWLLCCRSSSCFLHLAEFNEVLFTSRAYRMERASNESLFTL
jgi:hypothetical protein